MLRLKIAVILSLFSLLFLVNSTYAFTEGTWTTTTPSISGVDEFTATLIPSGNILKIGGLRQQPSSGVAKVELYDFLSKIWIDKASLNQSRYGHQAVLINIPDGTGNVLIIGGRGGSSDLPLKTAEIYNPDNNTWTYTTSPMQTGHYMHTATKLLDGRVLVVGGINEFTAATASAEIYNPTTDTWTPVMPLPSVRRSHTATLLPDGKVLVVGGQLFTGISYPITNTTLLYNPSTNTWIIGSNMSNSRVQHAATVLKNGKVLVTGGTSPNGALLDSSEIYDPLTNQWITIENMTNRRKLHSVTLLENGKVLIAGGIGGAQGSDNQWLTTAELYDPSTGKWETTVSMNAARARHTATLLKDNSVLVVNGNDSVGKVKKNEIYTPPAVLGVSITPTPTPTPTPEPFLDLPWDYASKDMTFNDAALAINSFFDHTYPLLSSGVSEPFDFLNQLTTFMGETSIEKSYSSHDGYDFGSPARIESGEPVLAAASGSATLIKETNSGGGGNVIKIDHGNGYQTWYEHLQKDGLLVQNEGTEVAVETGQIIGNVGYSGNCYILGKNGKRIYNTPACAHIHFSVFQDKDEDNNFSNNVPDGATDPFGWQHNKDWNPNLKEQDPWENYLFNQNGTEKTGNKSFYLWKKKLSSIIEYIGISGGELTMENYHLDFPTNSVVGTITVNLNSAPSVKTEIEGKQFKSIGNSLTASAYDVLGNLYEAFLSLFSLTIDFAETATYNIKPETLSIYSSKDGKTWVKENTMVDIVARKATAKIGHFSYFALMGEVADTVAPTTTVEFNGDEGIDTWFRSNTILTLNAQDNEGGLGINHKLYKKDHGDWEPYITPLIFSDEGHYKREFYSDDKGGNVEDVKTVEFAIDKTHPEANIQFNQEKQDIIITGMDDSGTTTVTQVNTGKNREKVTIADKAGNALIIHDKDRNHGANAIINFVSLTYNNIATSLDRNRFFVRYQKDKNGKVKTFKQVYEMEGEEKIKLDYNLKKDITIIVKDHQKSEVKGMKILQLNTANGTIKYSY